MAKFLAIVLFCILGATLVRSEINKAEMIKEFMEFSEQCMGEQGATRTDIDDLVKKQPAASKEAKCMRACVMKKYKLLDANGLFDKAVALEHGKFLADGDAGKLKIANEMVETCSAIEVPADVCEATELYGKCFKEQAKIHGVEKHGF